ncbi:hypothetical protein [Nocardia miyunensis]|uniref:hypothetical protein n=1 Tax=Nocardia miyunensis TaxID=282684 RepID=UPI00082B1901|nr:hypothetical protein [Nocardia miyunensis]
MTTENPRPYVTTQDLRRLLEAGDPGAQLLLVAGAVQLSPGDSDGMALISRRELVAHVGADPAENQLTEQAELLNTLIRLQGA